LGSEHGAVFLISVSEEWSGSGKWWTRSGAGAEWLYNAWSVEGKLLPLHSAHILWLALRQILKIQPLMSQQKLWKAF